MRRGTSAKFLLLALFSSPGLIQAQVINEILYSPSTKQWVEIYNNTSGDVDLSQYKILDSGAATNGHGISAAQTGGSTILPAGAFSVIAKDVTSVSAPYLFKASLGVKTSGDTVTLKKGTSVIDTMTFTDTAGSGNSLQKFDTSWTPSLPTPGAMNVLVQTSQGNSSDTTSTSTTATSTSNDISNGQVPVAYSAHYYFVPAQNDTSGVFKVSAGRDRLATVGETIAFKAMLSTSDPNTSYFWNFGDGTTVEGRDAMHEYRMEGNYNVVLNAALFDNHAVSRTTVKVIDPDVHVLASTNEYTEIRNSAKYEINLYGWELVSGSATFDFPMDTIIAAGSSVKFSALITKVGADAVLVHKGARSELVTHVSIPNSVSTTTVANPHDKEIQALADKLIALNLELMSMQHPQPEMEDAQFPLTAAAVESAEPAVTNSTHWLTTLKHFFTR